MSKSSQGLRPTMVEGRKPQRVMGQTVENANTQIVAKRGRRPGKHSDKNYTQTSLYLPIALRNKVRSKLYEQGKEFSALVEEMLRDWLSKQL